MSGRFLNYLLAIALITAFFAGGLVFFIKRGGGGRQHNRPGPVSGGNISIFFDRAGNAVIIPYVKDKFGSGRATADVLFITKPYGSEKLGAAVRTAMAGCRGASPCSNRELLDKLGARDWDEFSADKRNISIYYKESYGIIFNATRRKADGVYEFIRSGAEQSLPPDIGDETLGSTVLLLLQNCR